MNELQMFKNEQLIPVNENDNGEVVVSGRDVHEFLEAGTQYTKWFERMTEYGFSENNDYIAISQKRLTAQGNETEYTDHIVKLDMAKELCMLSRNEKGKQARQYFIQVEKAWNSPEMIMKRALEYVNRQVEGLSLESAHQKQIIAELQPKATYYDLILQNKSLVAISVIAKDYGMSGTKMNELLNEHGVQYKMGNKKKYIWLLYAKYQDKGYTSSKTQSYVDSNGVVQNKPHTYWTQKGRLFIYDLLKQSSILPIIERELN
ncbi:MAG TPA: phage antirepressor KilAC domain-containing protein [Clostridiaceae bacterium]